MSELFHIEIFAAAAELNIRYIHSKYQVLVSVKNNKQ